LTYGLRKTDKTLNFTFLEMTLRADMSAGLKTNTQPASQPRQAKKRMAWLINQTNRKKKASSHPASRA
jgi:hypothetical protein